MAINAGAVFVELGARLDRSEFREYEKHLKNVREDVARKERYKAQLGGDFDPKAFRQYERSLKDVDRDHKGLISSNARVRSSFGTIYGKGGALLAAAGGLTALGTAFKFAVGEAEEARKVNQQTAAVLKSTGSQANVTAREVAGLAEKLSLVAGVDDEVIQQGENVLLTFTKVRNEVGKGNDIFNQATEATLDMSAALGTDLQGATIQVGKALNDPIKGITALRRVGVAFTEQQETQIKTLVRSGKTIDAQKLILKELRTEFGGAARANASATDRLRVAFGNLAETVGTKMLPYVDRAARSMTRFIEEMQDGTGAGGRFARAMSRIGDAIGTAIGAFNWFARAVRVVFRDTTDVLAKVVHGFELLVTAVSKVPGMGYLKPVANGLKDVRKELEQFEKHLDVGIAARDLENRIDKMRRRVGGSLSDIRKDTASNMKEIKRRLGADSEEGKDALASNFRAARGAIRRSIKDGKIDVKDGLKEIQRLMSAELKAYGITGKALVSLKKRAGQSDEFAANRGGGQRGGTARMIASGRRGRYFGGGWIGERGMIGEDTVPALLAPGEAVLNRHQQGAIEELLGDGFLDNLFARVQRPHALQKGGRVQRFASGGVLGAKPGFSALMGHFRNVAKDPSLFVMSGMRPGSRVSGSGRPSNHASGDAIDISNPISRSGTSSNQPPRNSLDGLHSYIGSEIPRPPRRDFLWRTLTGGNHYNHIHLGMDPSVTASVAVAQRFIKTIGGPGAAMRAMLAALGPGAPIDLPTIRAPRTGAEGTLGSIAQGALNAGARGATHRLAELVRASVPQGGPLTQKGDSGEHDSGGGTRSANRILGRRMAAARGWTGAQFAALDRLWQGESGWSHTADNPTSDAYGIPQSLPGSKMASKGKDWRTNPATQIAWGLDYIKGRYGNPVKALAFWNSKSPHWYSRGGFLQAWKNLPGLVRAQKGRPGRSRLALGARATKPGLRFAGNREAQSGAIQRSVDRGELGITKYESDLKQMETEYVQVDRKFGLSEELLLIEQPDGSTVVDGNALAKRLGELDHLIQLRDRIRKKLEQYRKAVLELMTKLRREINKLKRLLTAAKKRKGEGGVRERSGYQTQIETYEERITALRGIRGDLANEIVDSGLDIEALQIERASVAATKGEAAKVEDTPAETSADEQTQFLLEAANKQAAELAGQLKTTQDNLASLGGPGDIGGFRGGGNALGAVMAEVGGPGYGAARQQSLPGQQPSTGASGGVNVTVNAQFLTPPSGSQLVQLGDSVVSALGARPAIPTTSATVG